MKLLYLTFISLPSRSAHCVHIMKMCEAFVKAGAVVELVTPFFKEREKKAVLKYYNIRSGFDLKKPGFPVPFKGKLYFSLPFFLTLKKNREDFIFTRDLNLAFWAVLSGYRVLLELHKPLSSWLEKWKFNIIKTGKTFIKLIVISRYLVREYEKYTSKILICPDGVTVEDFRSLKTKGQNKRLQAGYTGHLYKGRGIEILVDLAETHPEADINIWGGNEKDIRYWKNVTENIPNIYFHGHVEYSRIPDKLTGCDILLMPYQNRVFLKDKKTDTSLWMSPMKMFEYMAAGKAIIASDLPALREVLVNKKNALLVKADDPVQWQKAFSLLEKNKKLRQRIGNKAKTEVEKKYTWTIRAKTILKNIK